MKQKRLPRKTPPKPIAIEVITTFVMRGVSNRFIDRYVVIARSVSSAVQNIKLREGEEILQAKEMEHKLVIIK